MTINIELLDEAVAHVEAHPESWVQTAYRCETGMCVAGWRSELSGGTWAFDPDDDRLIENPDFDACFASSCLIAEPGDVTTTEFDGLTVTTAHHRAQRLLGLDEAQADLLFAGGNSIGALRRIVARFKDQAESEAS